jgi:hypothetical protein
MIRTDHTYLRIECHSQLIADLDGVVVEDSGAEDLIVEEAPADFFC